jgi:RNA polymerase sigma-70 factor (ECF subfamily)|tara:strand:+ start:4947 stop:5570 length:624 start_codon:yes stop_codon:yes gene_type:complete
MTSNVPSQDVSDLHNPLVVSALISNRQAFLGYLVRRLNSRADAEDVLQTFSINVLARADRLRANNDEGLLGWLYAVLCSTLIDHFRKESRRTKAVRAFEKEIQSDQLVSGPDSLFDALCACLVMLTPLLRSDQADLVRRIDLEDADRTAVAAEMGITRGALAVRLHRARTALRKLLLAACISCPAHGFDDCACHPGKIEKLAVAGLA